MKFGHAIVLVLALTLTGVALAGPSDRWAGVDYLSGRLLLVMSESLGEQVPVTNEYGIVEIGIPDLDERFEEFECSSMKRLVPDVILDKVPTAGAEIYRTYVLVFNSEYPVMTVLESFLTSPFVQDVEPDMLYRLSREPNDPQFSSQYDKTIMGCEAVWDLSVGSPSIIVTGLDTGVDWRHPDLRDILWVNPGEDLDEDQEPWSFNDYPGDLDDLNGADDDGNGYVDDFLGWDFISGIGGCAANEDCDNIQDNDMFGRESHGTHVGGIMAAHGNNGIGVAGCSWVGTLMALRCGYLASDGNGYMPQSATIPGTYYAIANGSNILNMSYGGPGFSSTAQAATVAAWNAGLMLFGASGNDNQSSIQYPAGYENVIAVNATNQSDHKAGFSNYGTWTDISAPGVSIPSTVINGGYQSWDGTSMASPNAAGAAALLWSLFPDLNNSSVRDLMYLTAFNLDALNPGYVGMLGAGRVDIDSAAALLLPNLNVTSSTLTDPTGDNDGRLEAGETAELGLVVSAATGWSPASGVVITVTSGDPAVTVTNGTQSLGGIAPGSSASGTVTLHGQEIPEGQWVDLEVRITSDEGFERTVVVTLRVGRGRVLVVDDDGTGNFQRYFYDELVTLGANPDLYSAALDGEPTESDLGHYPAVFWVCGNETSNTLTAGEQSALTAYLNNGGRLLISAQGLRNDISGSSFFSDYLHAASDNDQAGDRVVNAVAGNPVYDGINLLLQGGSCANNGTIGPDKITPMNDGVAAFEYTNAGGTGAVMYDGNYKTIYFAFAIEAACGLAGTVHYSAVLDRTLEWFGVSTEDADDRPLAPLPQTAKLVGNYPNPFNPTTDLKFELASATHATLNVYDIQGRLVSELVNGMVQAGSHTVQFDGSGLASGVYFARLATPGFAQSVKMVLLK
ncbi:MAG: S8 family peptidase [Calditrichaeota bacterium]|nr:S8 family peptidase [Calditrichota bacterium]MCB9391052.1 S8 family peptidase [Calditrichota bacterium]